SISLVQDAAQAKQRLRAVGSDMSMLTQATIPPFLLSMGSSWMIPHLIHPAQVHDGLVRAGASTAGGSAEHYIPVGAGGGKIWKSSGVTWNAFVEPQWTVVYDGGVPTGCWGPRSATWAAAGE